MSIKLKLMQEELKQQMAEKEFEWEEAREKGDKDRQQELEFELEELAEVA